MNFRVINGPNLNMLGIREPEIYGVLTYEELCEFIRSELEKQDDSVEFFQSNCEGAIIDDIQGCFGKYDGIIINAGAYTHYSYAIFDALRSVGIPCVEVHISDVNSREEFRKVSVIRPACIGMICGRGFCGYIDAANLIKEHLKGV